MIYVECEWYFFSCGPSYQIYCGFDYRLIIVEYETKQKLQSNFLEFRLLHSDCFSGCDDLRFHEKNYSSHSSTICEEREERL